MIQDVKKKTRIRITNENGSYFVKDIDYLIPNLAIGGGFGLNGNPTMEGIIRNIYTNVELLDSGDIEIVQTISLEEV